ncbi:MAG TPA: type II toxin-antitoxin system VapC family toxin [Sphingomicrobium sp.]|nr:type II toxin-antitoxin system VapC family toxin [Sphingomicrobium sp.]
MTEFVLDASALIAMLREEPGARKVADAIAGACMNVFNYAEVVSYFTHAGMDEGDIDAMLDPLPVQLIPADKDLARLAGHLRKRTSGAGLSLGDRFCLALAKQKGLPAWTAVRGWKRVAGAAEVEVVSIR